MRRLVVRNRTISWFSRLVIAAGVLAGANTPLKVTDSKPGTVAATVGKSGSSADGSALVTAKALILPDLINGIATFGVVNYNNAIVIWSMPSRNIAHACFKCCRRE